MLKAKVILASLLLSVVVCGCGSKAPAEANTSLNTALSSLESGQAAGFISAVLPAQQAIVTSYPQWPFFQAVKSHQIDNEFDMNITDTTADVMVMLYFDQAKKGFSNLYFVMKNEGGRWYIDLAKTIEKQIQTNGPQAFQAWQFEDVAQ